MATQESGALSAGISEFKLREKSGESNYFEFTKWLAALEKHLRVTGATCFELKSKQLGIKEAVEIYKLLEKSQVVNLNISCNENLKGGMKDLIQFLVGSQIKKLSFCRCMWVSGQEFLSFMSVLKHTQVAELVVHGICKGPCFVFDSVERTKFMSHMLEFRLIRPDFQVPVILSPMLRIVEDTVITHLRISAWNITGAYSAEVFSSLFSMLHHTAITDLKLELIEISEDGFNQLAHNLRASKVVDLSLNHVGLTDAKLDILAAGLAQSNISSLDVSGNCINGSNSLGRCLIDTQLSNLNLFGNPITSYELLSLPVYLRHSSIVTLNVGRCGLRDQLAQHLIKCLRFSKVEQLNLSNSELGLSSFTELAAVLEDTALRSVDMLGSCLAPEGFKLLADCLKRSNLESIRLDNLAFDDVAPPVSTIATLLDKTKDTSVKILELQSSCFDGEHLKTFAAAVVNTSFTHLNLCGSFFRKGLGFLARQLMFTAVTHLDLSNCQLYDAGAETLANCIPDTSILKLKLTDNFISDRGAKALASRLKGSKLVLLDLSFNEIGDEGFETLVVNASGTFITFLDASNREGHRNDLLMDSVLLQNQTSVHCFVSFFKQIAPTSNKNIFRFDNIRDDADVVLFLEECFLFYKQVLEQSSAASVLVADDSLSLTMDKSVTLLKEKFPKQLAAFIINGIEESPETYVYLLKRLEELKLTKIVELLLLNRSVFMIDQDEGIMHPYVYQLLHKYNQPLNNTSVEPDRTKIVEYFSKHSHLDGAFDVISTLSSQRTKTKNKYKKKLWTSILMSFI